MADYDATEITVIVWAGRVTTVKIEGPAYVRVSVRNYDIDGVPDSETVRGSDGPPYILSHYEGGGE